MTEKELRKDSTTQNKTAEKRLSMDIGSRKEYPASALSNFTNYYFLFDDVLCASMEGLLQSFKFESPLDQVKVCRLTGRSAKRSGQERNGAWKKDQTLWWNGIEYKRNSDEYQKLLDRAFEAISKNGSFQKALLATKDSKLTHSVGEQDKVNTVLTEEEFCSRLEKTRTRLINGTEPQAPNIEPSEEKVSTAINDCNLNKDIPLIIGAFETSLTGGGLIIDISSLKYREKDDEGDGRSILEENFGSKQDETFLRNTEKALAKALKFPVKIDVDYRLYAK